MMTRLHRLPLKHLENGTIVRVDGFWGVLMKGADSHRDKYRLVDFWPPKGPEYVRSTTVADILKPRA